MGPRTPTGGTLGPRTPKCLGGTLDPGPPKWDPGLQNIQVGSSKWNLGPGTPKYLSGTWDLQFSIVLIVYSTINTLHFTCYKTLH